MPTNAGAWRALSKSTQGRIGPPGGGLARSTLGNIPAAGPAEVVIDPDDPEIVEGEKDENGLVIFTNGDIQDIQFVEVHEHLFANPDKHYTGYAADGFYYENGIPKPTHVPFKASWASEGEGNPTANRGPLDRFPERIFVITTADEVVILDADTLNVWMRFITHPGVSGTSGYFLGDVGTNLRKADFANGFLLVATSEGLRVADFREDICYLLGEASTSRSQNWDDAEGKGIVNREEDGFLEFAAVAGPRQLVDDDCTTVRIAYKSTTDITANVKENITVAAVGHPNGLTSVRLVYPAQSLFETEEHSFSIAYGRAWSISEDNDGDLTSPYFVDGTGLWDGDGVSPGDTLTTDGGDSYTITAVEASRLTLDPEADLTDSGASYAIVRRVGSVAVTEKAELFFANGSLAVTHADSDGWFDGTAIYAFSAPFQTIELPLNTGVIHDIAVDAFNRFFATDLGVYFADADDFEASKPAEYRYSSTGISSPVATYRVLEGTYVPCKAVALDPETGHLAVSATDGSASIVSEIDMNIQQTFRFIQKDTEVVALTAYRNAQGPPDSEED